MEQTIGFKSVGKRVQNCDMENREKRWRQSKPTDRWYLELLFKRLGWISSLNACATNCTSFKSCGVIPSFYIKMMKRRILQACSSMHSIKNGMFFFWANWTYLSHAGVVLPLLPPWLHAFLQVFSIKFYQIFQSTFLANHVQFTVSARCLWIRYVNHNYKMRNHRPCILGIRMQKNPQTREEIFWISTDFHGVMWVWSPTCTSARKFHHWRC